VNKAELQSQAKANLGNLAKILSKHSDTDILGEGDTDNSAAPIYRPNTKKTDRSVSSRFFIFMLPKVGLEPKGKFAVVRPAVRCRSIPAYRS
jgi:hypothetical protein